MTSLIKLTSSGGLTRNDTAWGPGTSHTAAPDTTRWEYDHYGPKPRLCSDTVIHAYRSVWHALVWCWEHVDYCDNATWWEAEGDVAVEDHSKVGVTTLTTTREIEKPDDVHPAAWVIGAIFMARRYSRSRGKRWNDIADKFLAGDYARASREARDYHRDRASWMLPTGVQYVLEAIGGYNDTLRTRYRTAYLRNLSYEYLDTDNNPKRYRTFDLVALMERAVATHEANVARAATPAAA